MGDHYPPYEPSPETYVAVARTYENKAEMLTACRRYDEAAEAQRAANHLRKKAVLMMIAGAL